jgi:GTP-binding protein EngB required for normal cell division
MEEVITEFRNLLNDTEKVIRGLPQGDRDFGPLLDFLHAFREKRLEPLHWRLQRMNSDRYVLSMVGLTNVGKSTLAHALLGHPVAPRRNGPATAIPVEYEYHCGPWRLQIADQGNLIVKERCFDSVSELTKVLEPKVFDPQPQQGEVSRERIIVKGPMKLLEGGLVFADTPGFGAAQAAGASGHEEALKAYLQEHVQEIMFCLSASNAMVSREERNFFESIGHLCSTVVVTKWDGEGANERRYEGKFWDLFPMCRFMFVNAKKAIDSDPSGHVEDLHSLFKSRSGKEERQELLRRDIEWACKDLSVLLLKPLQAAGIQKVPWYKAALANFRSEARRENITIPFE